MALRTEQVALERKIQKMREERAEVIEKAVSSLTGVPLFTCLVI